MHALYPYAHQNLAYPLFSGFLLDVAVWSLTLALYLWLDDSQWQKWRSTPLGWIPNMVHAMMCMGLFAFAVFPTAMIIYFPGGAFAALAVYLLSRDVRKAIDL